MESWVNFGGKKVKQMFNTRPEPVTQDLLIGKQRSYNCANHAAVLKTDFSLSMDQ